MITCSAPIPENIYQFVKAESIGTGLARKAQEFDARFEDTFHLREKGFKEKEVSFAQFLLSNMLGGIGYFYGSSVVDRSHPPMQDEENFEDKPVDPKLDAPHTLFTATPSRPFFPRGFYWYVNKGATGLFRFMCT